MTTRRPDLPIRPTNPAPARADRAAELNRLERWIGLLAALMFIAGAASGVALTLINLRLAGLL